MSKVCVKVFRDYIRGNGKQQAETRAKLRDKADTWIIDNRQYSAGTLVRGEVTIEPFAKSLFGRMTDFFVIKIYEVCNE